MLLTTRIRSSETELVNRQGIRRTDKQTMSDGFLFDYLQLTQHLDYFSITYCGTSDVLQEQTVILL